MLGLLLVLPLLLLVYVAIAAMLVLPATAAGAYNHVGTAAVAAAAERRRFAPSASFSSDRIKDCFPNLEELDLSYNRVGRQEPTYMQTR